MRIRFRKDGDGGGALTYMRDDGSTTGMRISGFFAQHDLMHYAVETVLGLDNAFIGLIAAGRDIADFEKDAKAWLPTEAIVVETIVGQLLYERAGSASRDEFQDAVSAACAGLGVTAPTLTVARVDAARARFEELLAAWRALPAGETMELPWPADPDRVSVSGV